MASIINTNLQSLNAQRSLSNTQNALSTAMQRLSSGLRINSAKDDAAGLAISDRMTAQINGLNQAVRNANDGASIAQVAEGALGEITNNLQRMRQLAVQSANDTNSATDRASLQKEVAQLQQEITRQATQTQFNGKNLLDGSFASALLQVGAYANQTISFGIGSAKASDIGTQTISGVSNIGTDLTPADDTDGNNGVADGTLTIKSGQTDTDGVVVNVDAGDSAKVIAEKVNALTDQTGVKANATTSVQLSGLVGAEVDTTDPDNPIADKITFTLQGTSITVGDGVNAVTLDDIASAINSNSSTTGVSATRDPDGTSYTLKAADGSDIKIGDFTDDGGGGATAAAIDVGDPDATPVTLTSGGTADSIVVGGQVSFTSPGNYSVIDDGAGVLAVAGASDKTATSTLSSVDDIDISTQDGANKAIDIADGALAFIDDLRANLGAIQNRLSSVVASNQSTAQNVTAARSQVQDADFAAETANLSRAQVLQQAGTAMVAQANQLPQGVLALLR